jgi:predicted Fe-S protein YdhL (DUF1289 family)
MAKIASPCVRNCCLNHEDICLGCFRALTEITQWLSFDSQQQCIVMEKAEQRKRIYHAQLASKASINN